MSDLNAQPEFNTKPAKKKKKNSKKRAQNNSPAVSETQQPETYTLPVKPDEWYIHPATYTAEGAILEEERFVFYKDSQEIISLPLTTENFATLTGTLHTRFADTDYTPDNWNIKQPLNHENPVMSLTKNGYVLAATELDQKTMKAMVKALNGHIIKPPTLTKHFGNWWAKHKVLRVFLTLALIPVALLIMYSLLWGLQN